MSQSSDSSPPPGRSAGERVPEEPGGQSSQETQAEFPSRQIKPDKADNIGDPDRNNSVIARDENTGHNKTAAGLAPSAVDAPAVNSAAANGPEAGEPPAAAPGTEAAASGTGSHDTGEPATVQFAAVPPEDPEPAPAEPAPAEPALTEAAGEPAPAEPAPAEPAPADAGEPATVQFAAIPPDASPTEYPQTVIVPEPVIRPPAPEPAEETATVSGSADAAAKPEPAPAAPATVAASARPQAPQGHTRVDARLLEAALLNLRKRIAAIPLVFQISGSAEVKIERGKLLSQIDDYLLPRVRRSAAPILVALVGSTGAGKSTLVNSIVGAPVSATGVRRPTTNSPVLACHPDEIDWFAENNFLPTLPRVRQEGLARPGRDGLLVLAASEGMPRGIALLDTPDIDSVVQAHHEFACSSSTPRTCGCS